MLGWVMWAEMPLVLSKNLRFGLLSSQPVAQRCLNHLLFQHGSVLQGHGEGIRDGSLFWVMVVFGELGVFDARDALSQRFDKSRSCGLAVIRVVGGLKTVKNEHR